MLQINLVYVIKVFAKKDEKAYLYECNQTINLPYYDDTPQN